MFVEVKSKFNPGEWIALLTLACCASARAGEPALQPLTVCEVMQDLAAYDGKVVAVIGRFSYRQGGRWLGEQKCAQKVTMGDREWPYAFWIAYDPAGGPKPPSVLAVDSASLEKKLRTIQLGTALTKLPFGSKDYDSWALVYGRVETRKDLVVTTPEGVRKNGYGLGESSPARLVCHGEAEVVFVNE